MDGSDDNSITGDTTATTGNWFVALKVVAGPWWQRVPAPPPDVRLFVPDDLHITVAFLGPVGAAAAEAAFAAASLWPVGVVEARLGRVAPMGNPRRPSALSSIVTEGSDEIVRGTLAVRGRMLELAGARAVSRDPLPHMTIARPKRRGSRAQVRDALAWAAGVELGGPWVRLERLVLYTKASAGAGRLFREHAAVELGVPGES